MRTENEIRNALDHDLEAEPGFTDDWDAFRRRVRRSSARQAVTSGVAAVTALALVFGGFVATRSAGSDGARGFAGPIATGIRTLVDTRAGFELTLPDGWTSRRNGTSSYVIRQGPMVTLHGPPPGTPQGGLEFSVAAEPWRAFDDVAELYRATQGGQEVWGTIGGRPAVAFTPSACCAVYYVVDWSDGWVMTIALRGNHAWYTPEGERAAREIFQSRTAPAYPVIRSIAPSRVWEPAAQTGRVDASIPMDEITRGLTAFLERRIEGEGAETYLSSTAAADYAESPSQLNLYDMRWIVAEGICVQNLPDPPPTACPAVVGGDDAALDTKVRAVFSSFEVRERQDRRDGNLFVVAMVSWGDEVYARYTLEHLLVRADDSSPRGIFVIDADEAGSGGSFKEEPLQDRE